MKFVLHIVFVVYSLALFAQQTYVPDDNFEQALIDLGYDDVLDDYVLTSNISNVTNLAIHDKGISNLTGIKDFSSLEYLSCSENELTEIDLSQNINIEFLSLVDNNFTIIDVRHLQNLKTISCSINPIANLDLTQNTILEEVYCLNTNVDYIDIRNGNNQLITVFNTINNPNLTCIFVDDSSASFLSDWWIDNHTTFVETQAECDALIGVPDIQEKTFNIYPNPSRDFITISYNNLINNIYIFDLQGKLIKEFKNKSTYNLSQLKQGMYYIKIISASHTEQIKLIKN